MDPLSVTASSIAVASAASFALKVIHQTYKAKPELLALSNEVTDMAAVLREVERSLQLEQHRESQVLESNSNLFDLVSEVKKKLEKLERVVSKWVAKSGSVDSPQLRWMRVAFKVKSFRDDFRTLKSKLKIFLPALTIQGSSRVELDLRQIMLFTKEIAQSQNARHGQFQSELEEHRNYLETISGKLDARSSVHNVVTDPNVVDITDESTQQATAVAQGVDGRLYTDESVVKAFHHNGSILFDSSQMTAISAVGIRTAQFPRSACQPWCSCACHTERRLRSPQLLDQVIGSLFIGYSGLPGLTRRCNQRSCHLQSQPMTYITYFFPQWFLARMISFVLSTTPLAGPVASLKVSRTVPGNSAIFEYAKRGDIIKMRSLFEGGLASPHDVQFESGITALHLAISHRQYSVCKFLLQANADPFMEDRTNWTSADNAWSKILSNSLDEESERILRGMFSETECLERRDFSVLHKIVLKFVSLDLETELIASTAGINTQDSNERTPLSIAAERASNCGASPLHFAASARDPGCIPLLVANGADPNSVTGWSQTPLHYAAAYTKDIRHAEMLLSAGSNPEAVDLDGMDPLEWTAITGNTPVAIALLERGVSIFNRDNNGDSALIQSIRGNHHGLLALLIRHGALAELNLPRSDKTWHVIATTADLASMRLLNDSNLAGGSMLREDASDLLHIVESRHDTSEELNLAFQTLLGGYESTQINLLDDEDMIEVWEDAMESV